MNELRVKAELGELDRIRNYLHESLKDTEISEEDYFMIELSLHEICINIILYAYPDVKDDLVVKIWHEEGKAYLEVRDKGIAFDPRQAAPPDIRESIRTGKRGGFGIYLVKVLMDGLVYKREAGENVLTVFKKFSGARPVSI